MNWIITENNKKIKVNDIPIISIDEIKNDYENMNLRLIGFFGQQEGENIRLYVILADDKIGKIYVTSSMFTPEMKTYESFSQNFSQFHIFEREFSEEFNIVPLNHPWLKPLRKNQDKYTFFEMRGDEVHQVAVGPIHAGVIEPGHFRFMCHGEKVYDLEIMLGYQHRGIENILVKENKINNRLAESICGDSVIAYNMAYSQAMESLSDLNISERAQLIRRIALEMERIAIHIGDMGAIAGDIAYQMGASIFGVTRTLVINTMLEISGNRFGRGLIDVGGVNFDINKNLSKKIIATLDDVSKTVDRTTKVMLDSPTVISRLERTGVVSNETAKALGAVGMAARASGIDIDSRFNMNDELYTSLDVVKPFKATGDVYSRFKLRYKEIKQSMKIIKKFIEILDTADSDIKTPVENNLSANSLVVSIVEGWRGEVVHTAITGINGELSRYKIKDPSFTNWYMLAMAVRNNGISDFPLCNKSFNLSYCGNDLKEVKMLDTLKLKYFQGKQYIPDIKNAEMREQFRGFPILKSGFIDETVCPTGALKSNPNTIDMGKCTFCGACKCDAIDFSNFYKLSSTDRNLLIITEKMTSSDFEKIAIKSRAEIKKVFGKSLKLRQVSAGGCNGCEMELNACSNCNFDMGRFGIDFVASPKHADGLVITGPITKNMAYALEDCYKSTPDPKIVILAGACAISGGVFQQSTELNREFLEKYPIDLYIPGCPVHPLTFINGVLNFITK